MEQTLFRLGLYTPLLHQLVHVPCNLLVSDLNIDVYAVYGMLL